MKTKYLIPLTLFSVLGYTFYIDWRVGLWTMFGWFVLCIIFLTLVEVVKYRRERMKNKDGYYFEKKY